MDIENAEWKIFETIDIDYACAYFKQFLFRRDTRFFGQSESLYTANHGPLTEFQASFKLDLLNYGSSGEEVIWFMLSIGELYFVNKNYL